MKKGFILSVDVMMAVSILLLLTTFLVSLGVSYSHPELRYQRLYLTGKDVMTVLEKVQIKDLLGFPSINESIEDGMITEYDMDKTLLDIIGAFWASGNVTLQTRVQNITDEIFDRIVPQNFNFEVLFGDTSIYRRGNGEVNFLSRSSTIASGYELGKPVSGWVARAWATKIKKNTTKVVTFDVEGSGNYGDDIHITKYFQLNATKIINATLYLSFHYQTVNNISINGQDVSGSINWLYNDGYTEFGSVDVTNQIRSGNNSAFLDFDFFLYHAHLHPGTRIEILYETDQFESASTTVTERHFLDNIVGYPATHGSLPYNSGAWQLLAFNVPENSTVKNVTFHLRALDIEDSGSPDVRVWFNTTLVDTFNPPPSGIVDETYNFTNMTTIGTNWVLVHVNYFIDDLGYDIFLGDDETIIYSDPFNDPDGSSYVEVEYEKDDNKRYYGFIDIGMSENAGGGLEDPKTFSVDFDNSILIDAYLHIAQLRSWKAQVTAWPEGQPVVEVFNSTVGRVVPANIYIAPSNFDTSVLNYIKMDDLAGSGGPTFYYYLPETSLEYSIWVPSMVGYGEVNATEQGALDDAEFRLNQTLGKYIEATSISTDVSSVSGIPTLWGPARLEVRVWV